MRKLIIAALVTVALTGCGTILPAGYGVFAPEGSEERIAAREELGQMNGLIGAFAAGAGRSYSQPRPQIQRTQSPVYTQCTSNRFTGANCISQ